MGDTDLEFQILPKQLEVGNSQFKQDPKFVEAIDRLYSEAQTVDGNNETTLDLPNRKLEFNEVREFFRDRSSNRKKEEQPEDLIKEANIKNKELIKKIEKILDDINRIAEQGEKPKLIIRNQKLWSNCIYDCDRVTLKSFAEAKKTTVCYSSSEDKTRFNTIVFVLTKVHEMLTKRLTVTRRELFYQNITRLRKQSVLDAAVRDVCCLLETPPWDLGLIATAKGLVAGPLVMVTRDGTTIDCMASGGTLIPQDVPGIQSLKSTAKYILVVEKDAIFQKLLDEGALLRLGPVIIITGKGYPDVCTRQLVVRLVSELMLPALALVDADPHGMEIYLTYKYGSLAQSHLSTSLSCGALRLLGARYSDVATLAPAAARLPLSALDRRKLNALLKRPYLNTPAGVPIREDLQAMMSSGVKAELEGLAPTAAALCDAYIPAKLMQLQNNDSFV